MSEGMREAGVVVGEDGIAIHWHLPEGRSSGYIPDTSTLWEVFRANRDKIGGYAHTHPGSGPPGPSTTDVTTFSAIERGLGKRFDWWILSSDGAVVVRWKGPGKHDYAVEPFSEGHLLWAQYLRVASDM